MSKKRDNAIFWGVIGVITLAEALTVFGKAIGYWKADFPFWASIFVWIGFAIVYTSVRKLRSPRHEQYSARFWTNDHTRRWFERWSIWNSMLREYRDREAKENENNETCC
jgi:predicted tellurium resistance membrane protein TerC